jgi:hypothetical protein
VSALWLYWCCTEVAVVGLGCQWQDDGVRGAAGTVEGSLRGVDSQTWLVRR